LTPLRSLRCAAVSLATLQPMGWQTWCSVGPCGEDHCNDGQIREMADTLVKKDPATGVSMQELGYNWIVLDDCWHPHRASNGSLVPFPRFFPHGMKPVIDYVHSLGLTFGLCACAARPPAH
jgi:alpha-galactosidase